MDQVRMERRRGGTEGEAKGTTTFSVLHIHTLLTQNTRNKSSISWCIHNIHHPPFHSLKAKTNSTACCLSCRCVFCSPPG